MSGSQKEVLECEICGKQVKSKGGLTRHQQTVHFLETYERHYHNQISIPILVGFVLRLP